MTSYKVNWSLLELNKRVYMNIDFIYTYIDYIDRFCKNVVMHG